MTMSAEEEYARLGLTSAQIAGFMALTPAQIAGFMAVTPAQIAGVIALQTRRGGDQATVTDGGGTVSESAHPNTDMSTNAEYDEYAKLALTP